MPDLVMLNRLAASRLLRRVLDRDLVLAVAARVRQSACRRGWLKEDGRVSARMHGTRLAADDPDYVAFLAEILSLPEVDALRSDRSLRSAVAEASGQSLEPLRADICRITFPGEPGGTPAHQDAWYCKVPRLWIAWIPLVACSRRLGTLEIADRELPLAAHDENGLAGDLRTTWCPASCGPGDVLLFSGLTPHRSLPNRSAERPRLSLDLRFGEATSQGESGVTAA
ncbi:phytanoyl-CoA dioxygenase family protein [Roseibium salinum]|uniref:Phytanoyl-CoA dioxygenase family protein n=1 Tax=Roseibium salinum TaxID=1604349 RepID=A0ABT3QVG0_9HYPH|nr:phytanoyl-CoA dioxygenase family protein [Roseibium sp. DSM 29163]MCX2720910.1 phytanoyl-CoA dioxygenase family protein [Roseibium sp. DSM 29163]MDN3722345.1 phytanoyl-CoA dioxygenase family protein [Roseibium salinum]